MKYALVALALSLALVPGVLANSQLLHNERGDFAIGIQNIETRDFGERGLVTSVQTIVRKTPNDNGWMGYEILLEIGKNEPDYYGNLGQRSIIRRSMRRFKNGNTVQLDLVGVKPLSVTRFDRQQVVGISLIRQGKTVAHASGVFDLSDFS